ncbi:MAG: hypothetical protein Tsb0014_47270 [Pleurocapsa sp.]
MWKIKLFKPKKNSNQSGFITLEILVAIFIALGFVAVSMQTLVYAMMIKVQAQEKQRTSQLIQEDIETANRIGSTLTSTTTKCNATSYADSFAKELWDGLETELGTNPTDYISASGGKQIRLQRSDISSGSSTAPYRNLKIRYEVQKQQDDGTFDAANPVAETYVEIIPDAALSCP